MDNLRNHFKASFLKNTSLESSSGFYNLDLFKLLVISNLDARLNTNNNLFNHKIFVDTSLLIISKNVTIV